MTVRKFASGAALAGAVATLIAGALALWLSTGSSGHAAIATQEQGTTVTVQGKAISWEDNSQCGALRANHGLPSPAVGANFGSSPPGGGLLGSQLFLGCVLSNSTWNVEALATNLTNTDGSGESIPAGNLTLRAQSLTPTTGFEPSDPVPAPINPDCDAELFVSCSLGTTRTVVSGATPSPGASGFMYLYQLAVPGSAPSGTYNGSVTFTASN
jgi:hypothetical protein